MVPGETTLSGAPPVCSFCGVQVELQVLRSGAGHYIGTMCHCGPYTRESQYFASADLAVEALAITRKNPAHAQAWAR